MSISKIKIDGVVHEIKTTIPNIEGLQDKLDKKADVDHIHSWNDLTDKPFYKVENVVLEETDAEEISHPTFGKMWQILGKAVSPIVGETYTIVYNGTPYDCVCYPAPAGLINDPDAVAMGNFSVVGGANTGEPFAMLVSNAYQEIDIIDLSSASSVKVEISHGFTEKMDLNLLPNGVPYIEGDVVEILPKTTFNLIHQDGIDSIFKDGSLGFIAGEKYKVVYNGVEYECTAKNFTSAAGTVIGFGNLTAVGIEHNSGEPFGVVDSPVYNSWFLGDYNGNTKVTVSIRQDKLSVRKIDPRCLPNGVPYVEEGTKAPLNIEWDGDKTGREAFSEPEDGGGFILVKVSDAILSLEDVTGATVTFFTGAEDDVRIAGSDSLDIIDMRPNGMPMIQLDQYAYVVLEPVSEGGLTLTAGVWFMAYTTEGQTCYTKSLSNPNVMIGESDTIRKLDNRCLDLEWLPTKEKTVKIEKMSVNCSMDAGGIMCAYIASGVDTKQFISMVGQEVEIIVDGVSYIQTVKERVQDRPGTILVERDVYVGNAGLGSSSAENTGEPFFFSVPIDMDVEDMAIFGCGTAPGVHTIEMYGDFKPHKLPVKFLPDGVPYISDQEDPNVLALELLVECGIVKPACQNDIIYISPNNEIYAL